MNAPAPSDPPRFPLAVSGRPTSIASLPLAWLAAIPESEALLHEPLALESPSGNRPRAESVADLAGWLTQAARLAAAVPDVQAATFWEARRGRWRRLASHPEPISDSIAEGVLADASEEGRVRANGPYLIVPLGLFTDNQPLLLTCRLSRPATADDQAVWETGRAHLARVVSLAFDLNALSRGVRHRDAILGAVREWAGSDSVETLLSQIAMTATRLLGCERATIFLHDRSRKQLVGRPALGIASGTLIVPHDRGIVGQVLTTGQTRRVDPDADLDQAEINRQIDQSTGFTTRSVLAVPIWSEERGRTNHAANEPSAPAPSAGRTQSADSTLRGVFQALNKTSNRFTETDEQTLTELARHVAGALGSVERFERVRATSDRAAKAAGARIEMIGHSAVMRNLAEQVERLAQTNLPVLILGENGTGKEVVGASLHYRGPRRAGPFVAVNCAAMPDTLMESELFGHERGAFTGADQMRPGKFELADGGTLFLDEIGELSTSGQAKLLRVLEDRRLRRLGGQEERSVDVRVLAATNRDLAERVRAGEFREDLFYRLAVATVELPPLRARERDVLDLAHYFLERFSAAAGRPMPTLSDAAQRTLLTHPWPGNVRELRNAMERLAYLHNEAIVRPDDLFLMPALRTGPVTALPIPPISESQTAPSTPNDSSPQTPSLLDPSVYTTNTDYLIARLEHQGRSLADVTAEFQSDMIQAAIAHCRGNMTKAADLLGLHRANLYRKMRQLGLSPSEDT